MIHKTACGCCVCKSKRGEYKGINSPHYGKKGLKGDKNGNWKGELAKTRQKNYCIDCGKEINRKYKRCKSCSRKGIKSSSYIDGRSYKEYYCIEDNCNNKISINNWRYGKKRCKSCCKKGIFNPTKRQEVKERMSLIRGGTGIPYEYTEYGTDFNKELKEKVRIRDNYSCCICKIRERDVRTYHKKLNVHHIDYDKKNNDINNLMSLCHFCHQKTNYDREQWTIYFNDLLKKRGLL